MPNEERRVAGTVQCVTTLRHRFSFALFPSKFARRAYTLVELVVAMATATVLLGAIASAMVLASHAVPTAKNAFHNTVEGYHAIEEVGADLFCAQTFLDRTPTAVEFTVADRDNDGGPETIRYQWSGTPGDPLTRQYNGGSAAVILDDVHDFSLGYVTRTQSETTVQNTTTWTQEAPLAYFDGWAGITPSDEFHTIGPGYMDSECFTFSPPGGATEAKVTRASLVLAHGGLPPLNVEVRVSRPKSDGSFEPEPTAIGTPALIPGTQLTTSPLWHDGFFSDVSVTDLTNTGLCVVVTVSLTPPASVYYYYNRQAPDNGMVHRWTMDGGATWEPPNKDLHKQDLRFYVYGSYATGGEQQVTVDRYFVTSAQLAVQTGSDSDGRVETSMRILNEPEVTSP